jgi:hypothetical protein
MSLLQRIFIALCVLSQLPLNALTLSEAAIDQHKTKFVQDEHKSKLVRIGLSAMLLTSSAGGLYWWMSQHRACTDILAAALVKVPEDKIKDTFATLLAEKKDDSWRAWISWIGSSIVSLPILLVRKELSDLAYRLSNPYIRQIFKLPGARLLVLPPHAQAYLSYHSHTKTVINEIETKVNQGLSNEVIAEWLDTSGSATLLIDSLEKIVGYCESVLPKLRDNKAEYNRALQLVLELRAHISMFDPYEHPEKARAFYVEVEGKIRTLTDLQNIS